MDSLGIIRSRWHLKIWRRLPSSPYGILFAKVMSFGLKNVGATYHRAMVTIFHDMIHKKIEVYVDDMIAKSKSEEEHLINLRNLFERLRKFKLKLNPTKFWCEIQKTSRFRGELKGIWSRPRQGPCNSGNATPLYGKRGSRFSRKIKLHF